MKAAAPRYREPALLPPDRLQDAALVFVAAILSFLACLGVIAALAADRAASGWIGEVRGGASVIVRPSPGETADAAADRAAEALAGTRGVAEAAVLDRSRAEALLRPWLGADVDVAALPIPRMVQVSFSRTDPPTTKRLEAALKAARVDGTVDDHRRWTRDMARGAGLIRIAAAIFAGLLALAAGAVVAFATRAAFSARTQVVEVLHLAGAEDRYVAGLFQNHYALRGALAGVIGGGAAALVGAGIVLAGPALAVLPAVWRDLLAVLPCPLLLAIVAGLAARFTALGRLRSLS